MELPPEIVDELGFEPVEESNLTPVQREAVAEFRSRYPRLRVARIGLRLKVVCLYDPDSGAPELVPLE